MTTVVHPAGLNLNLMRELENNHPYIRTSLTVRSDSRGRLWDIDDPTSDRWGFVRIMMQAGAHEGETRYIRSWDVDGRSETIGTWTRGNA